MKVKKYVAPTMPEAMNIISKDLGKDAVILNSKVVYSGGVFGLFRKKNIEVIAAIDPDVHRRKITENKKVEQEKNLGRIKPILEPVNKANSSNEKLLQEIQQLQAIVNNLTLTNVEVQQVPLPFQNTYQRLVQQNMNPQVLHKIKEKCLEFYYKHRENITDKDARAFITDALIDTLAGVPFGPISLKKRFINVVGPTGVGKTTTLAKIAADTAIKSNKNIAFITTDTYRIAAVEQLKTYAKILNVPCEVCYNMLDFKKAIKKFEDKDFIFIDTAGRNFRNRKYVDELKKTIDFNQEMETYLVFSITAKELDMDAIYDQFSIVPIEKFIFTKIDETSIYGSLFNLSYKYQKGIAYMTTGQDVPDDIVIATKENIIEQIVGVDMNE